MCIRDRGAGVRAEGGPGTTEAMAAAGAGAPDVGADTPPQPAPAGRGAGGVAVVPGGPEATAARSCTSSEINL